MSLEANWRRWLVRLEPDRLGEVALLDEYGVPDLILCADPCLPVAVAELDQAGYEAR